MADNLPQDFRDVEQGAIVGEDSRGLSLTHYVLAERMMLLEYHTIKTEINESPSSDTLIYILEGGFRGFHKMTGGELWSEWKDLEDKFYRLYEDGELPYELYDEDPLVALEEDENGEVATYGKSDKE